MKVRIITILLATYLFLTLIAVVKITNIFKGPHVNHYITEAIMHNVTLCSALLFVIPRIRDDFLLFFLTKMFTLCLNKRCLFIELMKNACVKSQSNLP